MVVVMPGGVHVVVQYFVRALYVVGLIASPSPLSSASCPSFSSYECSATASASDRRMVRNSQEFLWQTSNMQYGDFYNSKDAQQSRQKREREGRCEVLTKNLINCRAQLGHMRLRGASPLPTNSLDDEGLMDPPTSSYLAAHHQRLKMAKKASPVKRSSKSYTMYDEAKPVHPDTKENQVGPDQTLPQGRSTNWIDASGIEEDTKQLEWLLNRLADKLQPLTGGELPILAKCNNFSAQKIQRSSKAKQSRL